MKFKTKHFGIRAGNSLVVLLHLDDAITLDVYPSDRVSIKNGSKRIIGIIDVTRDNKIVKPGVLGLFKETYEKLRPQIRKDFNQNQFNFDDWYARFITLAKKDFPILAMGTNQQKKENKKD